MCKTYIKILIKILILLIVIFVGAMIACNTFGCKGLFTSVSIQSYNDCAKEGHPVVPSIPPRCVVDEETVFVRAPNYLRVSSPESFAVITDQIFITGKAKDEDGILYYNVYDGEDVIKSGQIVTENKNSEGWSDFSSIVDIVTDDVIDLRLEVFDTTNSNEQIDTISIGLYTKNTPSSQSVMDVDLDNSFDPLASASSDIPPSVQLDVPFTPQAPHANWTPPFDEACEEASLLMALKHATGESITLDSATADIIAMTDWQTDNGYKIDISIRELQEFTKEYYQRRSAMYYDNDVTAFSIKRLIAAGYPVIIPSAGRELDNPYFSGDGPPYHMLVITGYDESNFITNDPGTKRGEDFAYNQQHLLGTIHDWNGSIEAINSGRRAMLILEN